jgi:hypothetical protein
MRRIGHPFDSFLFRPGTPAIQQKYHRGLFLTGPSQHAHLLLKVDHSERAPLHREILSDDTAGTTANLPKTGYQSICGRVFVCFRTLPEKGGQQPIFYKCSGVN